MLPFKKQWIISCSQSHLNESGKPKITTFSILCNSKLTRGLKSHYSHGFGYVICFNGDIVNRRGKPIEIYLKFEFILVVMLTVWPFPFDLSCSNGKK